MKLASGFYDKINNNQIEISDDSEITILDIVHEDTIRDINLWENVKLNYKLLCYEKLNFNVKINLNSKNSQLECSVLLLSKEWNTISWDIDINILSDNCYANTVITSLVWNNWINKANWNIFIAPATKQAKWFLLEQSIYLFEWWQSILLPKLQINTNDVQASHWAKIERLDKSRLFYIMSKGIDRQLARRLMTNGYLNTFFNNVDNNEVHTENFINYILW